MTHGDPAKYLAVYGKILLNYVMRDESGITTQSFHVTENLQQLSINNNSLNIAGDLLQG